MSKFIALLIKFFKELLIEVEKEKTPPSPTPNSSESEPKPDPIPAPAPTNDTHNGDDLDLTKVNPFINESESGKLSAKLIEAKVTAKLNSAKIAGHMMRLDYEDYSSLKWPQRTGANGKTVDSILYFFYLENGTPRGGKFDFKTPSQKEKTLENIIKGYGGMSLPPSGRDCWAMFSSLDGTQRSNTCHIVWL